MNEKFKELPDGTFQCLVQCGKCCSAEGLKVPITAEEADTGLYKHYKKVVYLDDTGYEDWIYGTPHYELKRRKGRCIYLKKNGQCGIYDHRPAVCRGYLCVPLQDMWLAKNAMLEFEELMEKHHARQRSHAKYQ